MNSPTTKNPALSSLLKFRFQRQTAHVTAPTTTCPLTPEKVTCIAETPESSPVFGKTSSPCSSTHSLLSPRKAQQNDHTSSLVSRVRPSQPPTTPDSPVTPIILPKGFGRKKINIIDSDDDSDSVATSQGSSPWLTTDNLKNSFLSTKSDDVALRVKQLRMMFPQKSENNIRQAVMSTTSLDAAASAIIGLDQVDEESKRKRTTSQQSVDESPVGFRKKRRIRNISSSDSDEDCTSNTLPPVDVASMEFLRDVFPDMPDTILADTLRECDGAMYMASTRLSKLMEDNQASGTSSKASSVNGEIIGDQKLNKHKGKSMDVIEVSDEEFEEKTDSSDEETEELSTIKTLILSFFEEAEEAELISMPGCSSKKANLITSLRPFQGWHDLVYKFENTKTLSFGIIEACREMIRIRDIVKKLMKQCETISNEMESCVGELASNEELGVEAQITKQPKLLNEKFQLKPYQMVGLNWLVLMHRQDLNGILADEMGLGKTIQTIAFLSYLKENTSSGCHAVIVPSSTLDNWLKEIQSWCPTMNVCIYYGSQDERARMRREIMDGYLEFDILLTSYNLATGTSEDKAMFKKFQFHYAVFDEAHMLKNMSSLRYKNLMRINAPRRLLLTGTPLQNNLVELMSLLCFVKPDLFDGKTDQLKKMFSLISKSDDNMRCNYEQERIAHAKRIMKPFVLRRLKSEVLKQLPKKRDRVQKCVLSLAQRQGYDVLKKKFSDELRNHEINSKKGASILMELRKMANHHLLHRRIYTDEKLQKMAKLMLKEPTHREANVDYVYEDMQVMSDFELHNLCKMYWGLNHFKLDEEFILNSGKFTYLDSVLPEMKTTGDRVLLFSQFTMVLDIIEVYMKVRGHSYFRLDGQTPVVDRQDLIDRFNGDSTVFAFLLSTRAGGLGINLCSANVVILHDIDFNPYNDKQAEDRCHRVGQKRDVTVIKLISEHTVEENMLLCAEAKLKLEQDITSTDDNKEVSSVDVASLLRQALTSS